MVAVPEKMKGLDMQGAHPVDIPVAQRTAFASIPVSRPQPVLTRQLQSTTRRTDCFGRRMDRIGSSSSLGCKREHPHLLVTSGCGLWGPPSQGKEIWASEYHSQTGTPALQFPHLLVPLALPLLVFPDLT